MYTKKKTKNVNPPTHPAPQVVRENVLHLCNCYLLDISEFKK